MRLSQDGETLVDFARQMLRVEASALAAVSDKALAGRVVLGMPDDYAEWLLPDIVKQFSRMHPLAEISVVCDTSDVLVKRVAAREIDLAVVTASLAGNAPFELVIEQPLVWVGAKYCSPHEQRPLPLALDGPHCGWRQRALEALDAAGIPYRLLITSRSRAAVGPIVQAGLALMVLPRDAVGDNLRVLDEADGMPALVRPTRIGIVRSPAVATREAKALAEVIRGLGSPGRSATVLPFTQEVARATDAAPHPRARARLA